VPTKIADGNHGDVLQGSPEKRLIVAPDGTLWALLVVAGSNGKAKFFRSTDGGATWTYSSGSDIDLQQNTGVPSWVIDADGYAHVSWLTWANDPQVVRYARGTPTGGGGWSWAFLTISPASGRLGVDTDIIAFRNGTGWSVWITWGIQSTGSKVSQVAVTAAGALSVVQTISGPASGGASYQYGSLEFNHTGDGVTPAATPHIFFTSSSQATSTPVRLNRALYSGGTWTWETPVSLTGNVTTLATNLVTVWDGARLMVAWSENSATIKVSEWDGVAAPTARNPPAAPGGTGNVLAISLAHDPDTDDIYLAYYDATDGDIRWSKFTRGANTWSAWAVAVTRTASADDGKVQLVRHPPRDSVDMIYGTGSGSTWQVFSQQLVALVRTPVAPTLVSPPSGAQVDLAAGATFTWTYNPVSPGDTQQAWAFRRIYGATTEYWNATSQSWSGSIVWNTSASVNPSEAPFAPGKWSNGTTYTWSVRTRSSTGADSAFATDRTVVATAAPVVDVTAPVSIVYGETTPLVVWTYTGLDAQRDYRIKVYQEAAGIDPDVTTPLWDSGVVTSAIARSARIGTALSDGVAYRAYVKVTSATAVSSLWDYSSFTISIAPPAGPLVELRDEIDWFTEVPRIRMDVLAQSNFMSDAQATGQSGWSIVANASALVAQADDTTNQLLAGLKITSAAAGVFSARTDLGSPPAAPYGQAQPLGPLAFPVVPTVVYTALATFKAAATVRSCRVNIEWWNADDGTGSLISTSLGDQIVSGTTSYVQAFVTATAPPTAKLARVVVEVLGATGSGEIFYISGLSLAPGRSLTWQKGGYSTTQTLTVERSIDGGITWEMVQDRLKPTLYQQAVARDRLMPFGVDVQYRAYTVVDIGTGATLSSEVSLISTILLESDVWAIRDPADDRAEFKALVIGHKRSDDESSSVHRPAGREYPVVDTEGLHAATGTLEVYVRQPDVTTVIGIIRRTVPMVVQSPIGEVFLARFIRRDYNVQDQRNRRIPIDYIEVI
jgi:hypothetical protein